MRVAIVQLGSFGDCVNSTLMFGPIRAHYGGDLQLDVYTCDKYRTAFDGNPLLNNIVSVPADSKAQAFALYNTLPAQVRVLGYDLVLVPAPILLKPHERRSLEHPGFGENLIYSFVRALEVAGIPYGLPLETSLYLTPAESRAGAALGRAHAGRRRVLMEVSGESGQTFWSPEWTMAVGDHLLAAGDTTLFVSCAGWSPEADQLRARYPNHCTWVGGMSLRSCTELYDHCDIFFSVSSGLANACNTAGRRRDVRWIETCNDGTVTTAPVYSEGRTYWHSRELAEFLAWLRSHKI